MNEKQIEHTIIYDGAILRVEKDKVELDDGSLAYREVVFNGGGVCVLAFTKDNECLLVKQFRYPSREELYEIPGGKREENESFVETGMRELKEETGYVSDDVQYFGYFYPTVAYSKEIIHMVVAKNCVYEKQCLDEGEFVEVYKVPFNEVKQMIYENKIKDGKTIIAFLKYACLND